jgi:hypothetical protein
MRVRQGHFGAPKDYCSRPAGAQQSNIEKDHHNAPPQPAGNIRGLERAELRAMGS